mmetsp:Transcript_14991/g.36001  ORF Transcript_14991/g.36001 Transcript_14991/m.36001 type:complete len:222 (+) Transcript_14991:594-1259(+)
MGAGGNVVRLRGVRGTIVVPLVEEPQEFARARRLELSQAGDYHLSPPVLEDLETIAIVQQVLDPSAVDFEYGDAARRILEGTSCVVEAVVAQREENVVGDHLLDSAHSERLAATGLPVREYRGPRNDAPPPRRPADVRYQRLGRADVHVLRGRILVECMIEFEGIVIAILGNTVDSQFRGVDSGRGMEDRHGVVFLLEELLRVERPLPHADANFVIVVSRP